MPMNPRLLRPRARQAGALPGTPASLLLRFDGNFNDSSPNALAVTAVGTGVLSTTEVKFGSGSGDFGSGKYLEIPDDESLDFGVGPFTVEFWINTTSFETADPEGGNSCYVGKSGDDGDVAGWWLFETNASDINVYSDQSGGVARVGGPHGMAVNQWYHIAAVRDASGVLTVYVNGASVGSAACGGSLTNSAALTIGGRLLSNRGGDGRFRSFDGYIDDLRIVKGLAVYTSNFTPPAAPLTVIATPYVPPPPTAPDAPTSLSGTAGDGQVSLSWTAPSNDGGAAITDYTVQYSTNGGSTWTTFSRAASTATTATVTGLTNGTVYSFRVAAVNSVGTGAYSSLDPLVAPRTTPDAPTSLAATSGNAQVALSWTAPASNGGAAITDYAVQFSSNGGSTWSTFADGTSTATSATVTGLTNGTVYTFRVAAVNSAGTGSYSTASVSVTPSAPPLSPTTSGWTGEGSEATKLTRATLTNITGPNTITINNAGLLRITATTSGAGDGTGGLMTIVAGGQTYTGNSGGTGGSWSVDITKTVTVGQTITFASEYANGSFDILQAWVIPPAAPPAPTSLTSPSQSSGSVYLTWAAPANDGGSAITDYAVQFSSNGGSTWTTFSRSASTALNATVTGLTNGTSYQFRVAGVNGVGTGSYSSTATATPTAGNSLTASGWSGAGTSASKLAPPASPATFASSPSITVGTSGTLNVSIVSDDNYNDAWEVIIRRNGTAVYSNDGNAANGSTFTVTVTSGQTITLAISGGGARWFAGTRLWVS
jgi:hypothetical protein